MITHELTRAVRSLSLSLRRSFLESQASQLQAYPSSRIPLSIVLDATVCLYHSVWRLLFIVLLGAEHCLEAEGREHVAVAPASTQQGVTQESAAHC